MNWHNLVYIAAGAVSLHLFILFIYFAVTTLNTNGSYITFLFESVTAFTWLWALSASIKELLT